ncbi:NAD-dependent epimerase/dehydratase family protein [Candidatus Nitronereus thalassa]|uniref:NAD-dependent epimerase/dehydratase family protein n=1 Tax=Candidatus Nitronereus thalassa TaxID=3020898 RepID=A0ABU3K591_9BACT|nr:NAD-dependent epimerase/dehydratase family protein [Candidatus Nitronereus thalassa]MDT7041525.1 NAD-dependent epimerase/dehydratase family protein [Candidatus Nitronereus thalassa]
MMKKIFITGGTGFIGCRLAEVLCERQFEVVALVRQWSRAVRLARLPIQMVHGDILNKESLCKAMKGCDVVFHCAVDNRVEGDLHRQTSAQGTDNVMQVAKELGVNRVVHLSSTAVFSYQAKPDTSTEEGKPNLSGDAYCDGKIESEKIALRYFLDQGLPVTVLRPTIVYGPFGDYSVSTIDLIRKGRMVLVNGGWGTCNVLYVDNLVEAMLLAAEKDEAVGKIFHISDESPVTWKAFIEEHAHALGSTYLPLKEQTVEEIEQMRQYIKSQVPSSFKQICNIISDRKTLKALRSIPLVRRMESLTRSVARIILPMSIRGALRRRMTPKAKPKSSHGATLAIPSPLSPPEVNMVTAFEQVRFSIEKAKNVLGYEPKIDFVEGMRRTKAWIQWARL